MIAWFSKYTLLVSDDSVYTITKLVSPLLVHLLYYVNKTFI